MSHGLNDITIGEQKFQLGPKSVVRKMCQVGRGCVALLNKEKLLEIVPRNGAWTISKIPLRPKDGEA